MENIAPLAVVLTSVFAGTAAAIVSSLNAKKANAAYRARRAERLARKAEAEAAAARR